MNVRVKSCLPLSCLRPFFPLAALALALALASFVVGGCEAPAADACEADVDCFGGEAYRDGRCRIVVSIDAGDDGPDLCAAQRR